MSQPVMQLSPPVTRTRILGIDSSLTSSGMCRVNLESIDHGPPNGTSNAWTVDTWRVTSKPAADRSPAGMSNRIAEIIAAMAPHIAAADVVVLEGQSSALKGSAAQTLPWLWGRIVDTTVEYATQLIVAAPSQRMMYATGKGNAAKDTVLAAAIHRWPAIDIDGNDTADALILAAIGCRYLGTPIDDMPKGHWERVMAKVNR
jgi:crossover junction endodeoxyribonuclease RuvC